MSIKWIPFPRAGTSVEPGKWLCTVKTGHTLGVEVLDLDDGVWYRNGAEWLTDREQVIGIAHIPDPMVTA
jgi:hypothetical protein